MVVINKVIQHGIIYTHQFTNQWIQASATSFYPSYRRRLIKAKFFESQYIYWKLKGEIYFVSKSNLWKRKFNEQLRKANNCSINKLEECNNWRIQKSTPQFIENSCGENKTNNEQILAHIIKSTNKTHGHEKKGLILNS